MMCRTCKLAADTPQQSKHKRCEYPASCTCQHRRLPKEKRIAIQLMRRAELRGLMLRNSLNPPFDLGEKRGR